MVSLATLLPVKTLLLMTSTSVEASCTQREYLVLLDCFPIVISYTIHFHFLKLLTYSRDIPIVCTNEYVKVIKRLTQFEPYMHIICTFLYTLQLIFNTQWPYLFH